MSRAQVPMTFRVYRGDALIREETLTQPVIKVGRLSSSHLRIDDESVSRMHAVIEVAPAGEINIIDLGSTKGTHVNGRKIDKAQVKSGDQIVIGNIRIELAMAGAAQTVSQPSSAAMMPPVPPRLPTATPPLAVPRADGQGMAPARSAAPALPHIAPARATLPVATQRPAVDASEETGGARAIEVAAMMGDSVVGVTHLTTVRKYRISSYVLFALGALMLALSAIAFGVGVKNASFNKAAREAWLMANRPAHEWRPRRLHRGFDFMAFGGAAASLTLLTMGLVRRRDEQKSPYFRIGNDPDVEFATSEAPAASFPLVAPQGGDFVFHFTGSMSGEVRMADHTVTLAEIAAQGRARASDSVPGALAMPIPPSARIKVTTGKNAFLIASVPAPRQQAVPLFGSLDSRVLSFAAGSAIVHLGLWALLRTMPPDPQSLSLDIGSSETRTTRVMSKANEDMKQEPEQPKEDEAPAGGTGTAMAGEAGKMGDESSKRASGRYAIKDRDIDPAIAKAEAERLATEAGIVGALRSNNGSAFAALMAEGSISSGFHDMDINGGLIGDEMAAMNGGFGFAPSGHGPGGGGPGWGTIGTGRYGTIGQGDGTGEGYRGGPGGPGRGPSRRAAVPQVRIGTAVTDGGLDKNIIRQYVRRKLASIKHCYEKELLVKPGLAGTVLSQFQISPQGAVLSSKASGITDEVASCVAEVVESIQFPRPQNGTLVQVTYPFTFRAAGV